MIATLALILLGLIILTWLYAMYVSWKSTSGVPLALVESAPLLARVETVMRLSRRGWYTTLVRTRQALQWSGSKAQKVFIKLFPKSAPAFAKRDVMTGLTHGPSSYFLKSIGKHTSTNPARTPAKTRRLPHNKNMI